MQAERAFFSFTEIPDPADHVAYNEWHQLDHRPENLALPGVIAGERWVRTPACAAAGFAGPPFENLHYLNMYWFAGPAERTIALWQELAERSFQWGRRADVHLSRRLMMGFHRPISGWCSPRILIGPDALPHRPNRGIHLIVTTVAEPRARAAERRFAWWERDYIPAQLERPGVAGCWTFAGESNFTTHLDLAGSTAEPSTRITIFYLDESPIDVSGTIDDVVATTSPEGVEEVQVSGPLEAIVPWQWGWFA